MNERAIFISALEREDPADRLAYLAEACAEDSVLRAHLDVLLHEHEQLGGFLESPASELAGLKSPAAAQTGGPILQELGDYRILREIGRGGMGLVYEAEQVSLGRRVALKVLPAHSLLDPTRLQRFQREAKAAARLHDTNIVPIYDVGEGVGDQAGLHYFAMQFIGGQSLDRVLHVLRKQQELDAPDPVAATRATVDNTLPAATESQTAVAMPGPHLACGLDGSGRAYCQEIARIGLQVADALDYAARQGILHRDIKPAEAMRLPVPPGHSLAELCTEAVAALALPDIEFERSWPGGMTRGIVNVAFDRNLKHYARLAQDGTVTVSRVEDNQVLAHWREDSPQPWPGNVDYGLQFSQDGRYLSVWHDSLRQLTVRRWEGAEPVLCCQRHDVSEGEAISFTPDSTRLAYVATDSRIAIVDLTSGDLQYSPPTGIKEPISQCAPDNLRLAIAGIRAGKTTVEIRDLATGSLQLSFPHPSVTGLTLKWHPDGSTLATSGNDRKIRLWDLSRGELLRTFEGHNRGGIHSSFDSAGARLLSNDWGGVLRLWEPPSGRQLLSFPARGYGFLQVSPDDRLAAQPVADSTVLQLLRVHGNQEYRSLASDLANAGNVVIHPQGRLVAVGSEGSPLLIDLPTGRQLGKLPTVGQPLLWDSAGTLFTFGKSGLFRWPVQTDRKTPNRYRVGPPRQWLIGGVNEHWGASSNARTIATPLGRNGAVLVQLGPPYKMVRLDVDKQDVRHCSVSPSGEWVAASIFNGAAGFGARIWEAASGHEVMKLPIPGYGTTTFSPDGRWLLTDGGGCRLWKVGTWAEGPAIGGPRGCFSPDARLLAVEDAPGVIRLVQTDTGAEVVRLESPEQSRLSPQCFSPDGTRLIACGDDTGSLHVWDLQLLRQELAPLGLDWNAPSYPEARPIVPAAPLQVEVLPDEDP